MKKRCCLSLVPPFLCLMFCFSISVRASNSYDYSLTEIVQPINEEHVMAILETQDYVLIKTENGIWKSSDWSSWSNVLNISSNPSDFSPWYVLDKVSNGWIFASFHNYGVECYVSKDNGSTWTKVNTYMRGSINSVTQLPNGTILATPHSADDGGIVWASDDGLNWRIWKNLTDIGQSIEWLNSSQRHRHAHHVFFDSEFGLFAVGGEGIETSILPSNKRTIYYDDSEPYGDNWKAIGEGIASTEIVKIPNALVLFPDYDDYPDIKYWSGIDVINLNILQSYSPNISPAIFRCVYKSSLNVIVIGTTLRDTYRQSALMLLTDDLKNHFIIENRTYQNGVVQDYWIFDGLGNHVYVVKAYYNMTSETFQDYKLYKLTISKITESPSITQQTIEELTKQLIIMVISFTLLGICLRMVKNHVV